MSRSKSWSSDKESSSSDWSSSDEDDDEGDEAPLRPSTHSALQAQWEWRTMADSLPDKWDSVTSYPASLFYGLWHAEILHDVLVDSWRIDPWSMNWKCSHVIWECLIEVTLHVRMLQERLGDWFKHFEGFLYIKNLHYLVLVLLQWEQATPPREATTNSSQAESIVDSLVTHHWPQLPTDRRPFFLLSGPGYFLLLQFWPMLVLFNSFKQHSKSHSWMQLKFE